MRGTLALLLVALSGSAGLILSGGAGGLTGKQRRQLRSEAGRQEASKTLRRIICAGTEASEVARSAPELDTQLSSGELVRIKFSQVRLLAGVAPLRARCGPRPHRVPPRHRCSGTRASSTVARSTG